MKFRKSLFEKAMKMLSYHMKRKTMIEYIDILNDARLGKLIYYIYIFFFTKLGFQVNDL